MLLFLVALAASVPLQKDGLENVEDNLLEEDVTIEPPSLDDSRLEKIKTKLIDFIHKVSKLPLLKQLLEFIRKEEPEERMYGYGGIKRETETSYISNFKAKLTSLWNRIKKLPFIRKVVEIIIKNEEELDMERVEEAITEAIEETEDDKGHLAIALDFI